MKNVDELRASAIRWSLRAAPDVGSAIAAMGFVQYDPIRAPARAQDLVLGQRIDGYRTGDLDRWFERPGSELDEGDLHVYGVMPTDVSALVHPRCDDEGKPTRYRPTAIERSVLALVEERGSLHSTEARALLGTRRTTNAWGGTSAATTRALEHLHREGRVRVSHRRSGTKVYESRDLVRDGSARDPDARLRECVLLLARLLAPISERSLREVVLQLRRNSRGVPRRPRIIDALRSSGELASAMVDGVAYVWPSDLAPSGVDADPDPARVRFLAPFDPVVWDRRRFEHLWGWPYRFEAYTPVAKRRLGYYALPLLWREQVVGWVTTVAGRPLAVTPGFVDRRPPGRAFTSAFDAEVERLRAMVR